MKFKVEVGMCYSHHLWEVVGPYIVDIPFDWAQEDTHRDIKLLEMAEQKAHELALKDFEENAPFGYELVHAFTYSIEDFEGDEV